MSMFELLDHGTALADIAQILEVHLDVAAEQQRPVGGGAVLAYTKARRIYAEVRQRWLGPGPEESA